MIVVDSWTLTFINLFGRDCQGVLLKVHHLLLLDVLFSFLSHFKASDYVIALMCLIDSKYHLYCLPAFLILSIYSK
jgi:hypothetical protein